MLAGVPAQRGVVAADGREHPGAGRPVLQDVLAHDVSSGGVGAGGALRSSAPGWCRGAGSRGDHHGRDALGAVQVFRCRRRHRRPGLQPAARRTGPGPGLPVRSRAWPRPSRPSRRPRRPPPARRPVPAGRHPAAPGADPPRPDRRAARVPSRAPSPGRGSPPVPGPGALCHGHVLGPGGPGHGDGPAPATVGGIETAERCVTTRSPSAVTPLLPTPRGQPSPRRRRAPG